MAQLTVVAYRTTGDQTDFFFVLPYQDPAGDQTRPLDFHTDVRSADVFFSVDTTASMFPEISNLQQKLSDTIVPGIQAQIPDTQFGVGAFEDFPAGGYGALHGSDCGRGGSADPDQPFILMQTITNNISLVQTGLNKLSNGPDAPIGCGTDVAESNIEALYQIATGDGLLNGPAPTFVAANHTGIGGVAFRDGTMPIVVDISDAASHGPGEVGECSTFGTPFAYEGDVGAVAHSRQAAKDALAQSAPRSSASRR